MVVTFSSGLLVSLVVYLAKNGLRWDLKEAVDDQCLLEISGDSEDLEKVITFINN